VVQFSGSTIGLGLTQGRQLGDHRGIFAVVLRGHAVEDLRVIMGGLAIDALDVDPVVAQRLPQGISICPR